MQSNNWEPASNGSNLCPLCGQSFEDGPDADPQIVVSGFTVHEGCAADAEPITVEAE